MPSSAGVEPVPAAVCECIKRRQLTDSRNSALKMCRDCIQTLREALGTTHFAEFIDASRDAHELLMEAQYKLDQHRQEHGC